jgi:hypothetical protein
MAEPKLAKKPPNEKLIETLFTHHALRYLDNSGATVYTPSSREEYRNGYDAALMGAAAFDELYLQFKTADLLDDDGYSLGTYEHQHQRLQQYPLDTAYYVTHLFRGVDQVLQAQRETPAPLDFLHWYVAIEIGRLANVQRIRYYADLRSRQAEMVLFKLRTDKKGEHPKTHLQPQGWMTGAELLERFKRDEVGARVRLVSGGGHLADGDDLQMASPPPREMDWSRKPCLMSPGHADRWVRGDEGRDWGTALRKNFQALGGGPP